MARKLRAWLNLPVPSGEYAITFPSAGELTIYVHNDGTVRTLDSTGKARRLTNEDADDALFWMTRHL